MRGLKITDLSEITDLAGDEFLVVVENPDVTPVNKKVTRDNLVSGGVAGQAMFTVPGTLSVGNDQAPWLIVSKKLTPVGTRLAAKTAPTGATLYVEFVLSPDSGANWYGLNTVGLPAGSKLSAINTTFSESYPTLEVGYLVRIDITQVGSTVAGADLTASLAVVSTV